jgi:hypothetical protein
MSSVGRKGAGGKSGNLCGCQRRMAGATLRTPYARMGQWNHGIRARRPSEWDQAMELCHLAVEPCHLKDKVRLSVRT